MTEERELEKINSKLEKIEIIVYNQFITLKSIEKLLEKMSSDKLETNTSSDK